MPPLPAPHSMSVAHVSAHVCMSEALLLPFLCSRSLYQRHGYTDVATLRPEVRKPLAPVYFVMVRRPLQQHNEQQQQQRN
jgi:hypothetical protein